MRVWVIGDSTSGLVLALVGDFGVRNGTTNRELQTMERVSKEVEKKEVEKKIGKEVENNAKNNVIITTRKNSKNNNNLLLYH